MRKLRLPDHSPARAPLPVGKPRKPLRSLSKRLLDRNRFPRLAAPSSRHWLKAPPNAPNGEARFRSSARRCHRQAHRPDPVPSPQPARPAPRAARQRKTTHAGSLAPSKPAYRERCRKLEAAAEDRAHGDSIPGAQPIGFRNGIAPPGAKGARVPPRHRLARGARPVCPVLDTGKPRPGLPELADRPERRGQAKTRRRCWAA